MDGYRVVEITRFKLLTKGRKQAAAIDSLRQQLKPAEQVTLRRLWRILGGRSTRIFAATTQGDGTTQIVGIVLLIRGELLSDRRDRLEELIVNPSHQGNGLGRALAVKVFEESYAAGARCIDLTVSHDNPRAWSLYKSMGFEPLNDRGLLRRMF